MRGDPQQTATPDSRLLELVRDLALQVDAGEGFVLASGRRSHYLFNLKNLYGHPEAAALMTRRLLEVLRPLEFDYVAGPELGAVPPVACAVAMSHGTSRPVRGLIVRKAAKGHGTRNRVEGLPVGTPAEGQVVIVEDVTTTGGSLLSAVGALREAGFSVTEAVSLLDREEGAAEALANDGIRLHSVLRKSQFAESGLE